MDMFEKLGVFYLGKHYDGAARQHRDEYLLYESKDLTTHAMCVGMTGSGKTGLCIGLLEEAAIDQVPAIIVDPKGDMANLALLFPDLDAASFEPWVSADEARLKNLSTAEFAAAQAKLWQDGLAQWDQTGERIRKLKETMNLTVYTPASNAGVPLSISQIFSLPPAEVRQDPEILNELIQGTSASLLGLLRIEADPLTSREHILISNILAKRWGEAQTVDLPSLIQDIQQPPLTQVGMLDLESFYPAKDRQSLALQLNNLIASPSFAAWMQGEPLDIDRLYYTPEGRPKISIVSIAHLSDDDRMFFVSMLLNQLLAWTRRQAGTSSLRAIFYMDEIFGYFPPIANPPSKKPLLTLLKQARAFGLGLMLTTQNPVDLDYKGLSNIGTWFIGRLQTDRDRARLLDGLERSADETGQSFDRKYYDQLISGLDKRVFLLNNIHDSEPLLFETRWCLSYLRGPLTRQEIQRLPAAYRTGAQAAVTQPSPAPAAETPIAAAGGDLTQPAASAGGAQMPADGQVLSGGAQTGGRPILPGGLDVYYYPGGQTAGAYEPYIYAASEVFYEDKRSGGRTVEQKAYLVPVTDGVQPVDWTRAEEIAVMPAELSAAEPVALSYRPIPQAALNKNNYAVWSRDLIDYLFRTVSYPVLENKAFKIQGKPGEDERDFVIRLRQETRELRDRQMDALRKKYDTKISQWQEKVRRAEQAVEREQSQAKDAKMQTMISVGSTILGSLFGTKKLGAGTMGKAATAARGASRVSRQSGDVVRSEETLEQYRRSLEDIENELKSELDQLTESFDSRAEQVDRTELRPLKRDIKVQLIGLLFKAE